MKFIKLKALRKARPLGRGLGRRVLPLVLGAALGLSCLTAAVRAAELADFPDAPDQEHWSYRALSAMVRYELLSGDDKGLLNPDGNLTRAEMAAIISRGMGLGGASVDLSAYSDVDPNGWYVDALSGMVASGYLKGDGDRMRPNDPISREEAFTVLGRIMYMSDGTAEDLAGFADGDQVASWAVPYVGALAKKAYVNGADGLLFPQNRITRAEFSQALYTIVKDYLGDSSDALLGGGKVG